MNATGLPIGHDLRARRPGAPSSALQVPADPPRRPSTTSQRLGRAATVALYDELALYPKPGLVSFVDSGSHTDMDARTFMRSLFSLRHYFPAIAEAGARDARFGELEALGIAAEERMLKATAGVNTHRGAIFTLGLLCAAVGHLTAHGGSLTPLAIRHSLRSAWGEALIHRARRVSPSHGSQAAQRHSLRHAGAEAAEGFPVLFNVTLPAMIAARAAGLDERRTRLSGLFHTMAVLADTNLAHRGGLAGLLHAQRAARDFLAAGGAARPDAIAHAESLHRSFVARRLSPGGSADVLAAACWVQQVCTTV